jgi:hypothetical protein
MVSFENMHLEKSDHINNRIEPGSEFHRREHLIRNHGMLSLIGAIALNAAASYKEPPAEAAEVVRGMTWEQGFSALKDDIFKSAVEQAAYVVVRKDGTVFWAGSKFGEQSSVRQDSADVLKTVEDEIASKSLESFCSFHTHPVRAAEHEKLIDKNEADDAVAKEATTLSVPPSGSDVDPFQFGSIFISSKIKRGGGYVIDVVLDPSGVWRHRMAIDADLQKYPDIWKETLSAREVLPRWKQHITKILAAYSIDQLNALQSQLPKREQDSVAHYERNQGKNNYTLDQIIQAKRDAVYMTLLTDRATPQLMSVIFKDDDMGRELQAQVTLIGDRRKRDGENWDDIVYKQFVPASRHGKPSAELYAKLTEAYLRVGTVIESFTYDEVAKDPRILCTWTDLKEKK